MIPLMKSAFSNEHDTKEQLCEFIMQTPRLSMGDKCQQFESAFSKFQGITNAVLFNSGASANLAILQSLMNLDRLKANCRVGFSALTWATNTMPIIQLGMTPVAVDCDPTTLNVMSEDLRKTLSKTKLDALFLTNALGFTGDLHEIKQICDEKDILLVEDNCEALGTEVGNKKSGNFGEAASFSFFVAHHMSTIEGGMVCTADSDLAEMLRMVRANGWDRHLTVKQQKKWRSRFGIVSEFEAKYSFYDLAYNLRPTEITGFLGLVQMKLLEQNIRVRQKNYLTLEPYMIANPDLIEFDRSHLSLLSSFATPVMCKNLETREKYISQFMGEGIELRPMIAGNIQRQPFYSRHVKEASDCPGADFIHNCSFYCGNYPELTASDLQTISSCLVRK